MAWSDKLQFDPIRRLTDADNDAIRYLAINDLFDEEAPPVGMLRKMKEPQDIPKKQKAGGYRVYGGGEDYRLPETFENLTITGIWIPV